MIKKLPQTASTPTWITGLDAEDTTAVNLF